MRGLDCGQVSHATEVAIALCMAVSGRGRGRTDDQHRGCRHQEKDGFPATPVEHVHIITATTAGGLIVAVNGPILAVEGESPSQPCLRSASGTPPACSRVELTLVQHAVISHAVARRTHELGMRLALAPPQPSSPRPFSGTGYGSPRPAWHWALCSLSQRTACSRSKPMRLAIRRGRLPRPRGRYSF